MNTGRIACWLTCLLMVCGVMGCDREDSAKRLAELKQAVFGEDEADTSPAPAEDGAVAADDAAAQPADPSPSQGPDAMVAHLPKDVRQCLAPLQQEIAERLYESMQATADLEGKNAYVQRQIRKDIREEMEQFSRSLTRQLGEQGVVGWLGQARFSSDGRRLTVRISFGDNYVPPKASGRCCTGAGKVTLNVTYPLRDDIPAAWGGLTLHKVKEGDWLQIGGEFITSDPAAVSIACPLLGGNSTVEIPVGPRSQLLFVGLPGEQVTDHIREQIAARSSSPQLQPASPTNATTDPDDSAASQDLAADNRTPNAQAALPTAEDSDEMGNLPSLAPQADGSNVPAPPPITVFWRVPGSHKIDSLPDEHPMNDCCQLLLRVKAGDDLDTFGFGVGPACESRDSETYKEYKQSIGDTFVTALGSESNVSLRADFEHALDGVTYDRWYAARRGKMATVLVTVQKGRAVCYWCIGKPNTWTPFRASLGKARFTINDTAED